MRTVNGTVRSSSGSPIEGVLVMGADLNYSETDAEGTFSLTMPEMALFFWCTGFRPKVHVLSHREVQVDVVLQSVTAVRTASA